MIYATLAYLVTFLLDLLFLVQRSEHAKDLEILVSWLPSPSVVPP